MRKMITTIACLLLALIITGNASACTAVYVGRQISEDGTTIIAKSNDYQDVWGN